MDMSRLGELTEEIVQHFEAAPLLSDPYRAACANRARNACGVSRNFHCEAGTPDLWEHSLLAARWLCRHGLDIDAVCASLLHHAQRSSVPEHESSLQLDQAWQLVAGVQSLREAIEMSLNGDALYSHPNGQQLEEFEARIKVASSVCLRPFGMTYDHSLSCLPPVWRGYRMQTERSPNQRTS